MYVMYALMGIGIIHSRMSGHVRTPSAVLEDYFQGRVEDGSLLGDRSWKGWGIVPGFLVFWSWAELEKLHLAGQQAGIPFDCPRTLRPLRTLMNILHLAV